MKNIYFFTIMASAIAFVSCRNENPVEPVAADRVSLMVSVEPSSGAQVDLVDKAGKFMISSTVDTRISVTNNVFENGDKIGLYLVEWEGKKGDVQTVGALESTGNQTDNHLYTYNTGAWGAAALTNPLTWRKVSAFAYHPQQASVADAKAVSFAVRADQIAGVKSADYLMWGAGAKNVDGYTPSIPGVPPIGLNFKHKTAHVTVDITLPSTYNGATISSIEGVEVLGVPSTATLNLADGVLTPSTKVFTAVKMSKNTGGSALAATFEAAVLPTTVLAGREVLKVNYLSGTTPGSLYFYAGVAGLSLLEGRHYTITLSTKEFGFGASLGEFAVAGEQKTASVKSSDPLVKWGVSVSADDSWITLSQDGTTGWTNKIEAQTGNKVFTVKAAANATGQARMGRVTLIAAGLTSVELLVFQN